MKKTIDDTIRRDRRNQRKAKAVSEVVGTLLLIGIVVSLFVLLSFITFTLPQIFFSKPTPSVNIIGNVEGNGIVLEHHGGQSIPLDAEIRIMFAETPVVTTVGNVLDSKYKMNGAWDIGEKIFIPYNDPNLPIMQISIIITDKASNSVFMRGILQSGSQSVIPIATTLNAYAITTNTAKINMSYNFFYYTGIKNVSFVYIQKSVYDLDNNAPWTTTPWTKVLNKQGFYSYLLTGLQENTQYLFQARIQYNSSLDPLVKIIQTGSINMFKTDSYSMGVWHFDELSGLIVIDSSNRGNNGTLFPPNMAQTAQRLDPPDSVHNRSLSFDGYNDYVIINHASSLSPTSEIAIEAWVKPEPKAELKTTNIVRENSTMFGIQYYGCNEPDMIKISSNIVAVVSRDYWQQRGYVYTTQISPDGNISRNATTATLGILQFESTRCLSPRIIKVEASADIYAIVYTGPSNNLYMTTVQIYSNGSINKAIKAKTILDNVNCNYPDINYTSGNYYAVAYSVLQTYLSVTNRYVGRIQTISISPDGLTITPKVGFYDYASTLTPAGIMKYLDLIHVNGSYFSIAYRDSDTDGAIRSVKIKSDGTITPDLVTYKFDVDNISDIPIRIIQVNNSIYAILYGDVAGIPTQGAVIRTIELTNTGKFFNGLGYAHLLPPADWSSFNDPGIIHITGNIFAVSYRIANSREEIKTIEISNAGVITNHTYDGAWKYAVENEINPYNSYIYVYGPKIIEVNESQNTYAIVYQKLFSYTGGTNWYGYDYNNGLLVTIKIYTNGSIVKKKFDYAPLGPVDFCEPDMIHIANDVYAVASRRAVFGNITLRTIHISNGGKIDNHFIDTLNIGMPEIYPGLSIKIWPVTNHIYMIVFDNWGNPAVTVKTVYIADDGSINHTIMDSYNITHAGYTNYCSPSICNVNPNFYAISYHLTNHTSKSDFITTFKVIANGKIVAVDNLSMNAYFSSVAQYDEYTNLLPVYGSSNLYALLFGYDNWAAGHSGMAKIMIIFIDNTGHFNQIPLANFTFNAYGCSRPNLINVNKNIYAIAYSNSYTASPYRVYRLIDTINISSNGTLIKKTDSVSSYTDTGWDFAHSQILSPMIGDIYRLVYTVPSYTGYVSTMRIATNGSIYRTVTNSYLDFTLPLFSSAVILPCAVNINNHLIAVCYQGVYDDGYIETIDILNGDATKTLHNIISKAGSYAIQGNDTAFVATLTTTSGVKTLTLPLHHGWNYLVLTYDHATIKFFNNLTNTSVACNSNIISTANNLIFGGFSGIYDEFAVYSTHLRDDEILNHYNTLKP
ncbi:MAG TPA: type IV pilin [Candidatus Thermoplasmatota archaeon]|nr:type IV pilin [Candidatus Thermoplasmatota archaeon]